MGRTRFAVLVGAAVLCVCGWLATSRACDTPVYRFALYSRQWLPWEYRVFYLHAGEATDEATDINDRLRELMQSEPLRTNLYFRAVNMADTEQTKNLPPAAVQVWEGAPDKSAGLHVVLVPPCRHRPRWTTLFAGQLDEATIAGLIDSPARQAMAKSLAQGHIPLMLLEGTSAEANDAAAKAVEETAVKVAAGKIRRRGGIGDLVPPPEETPKARPNGGTPVEEDVVSVPVDLVRVRRDDDKEKYFVQMLMLVEEDLPELAEQPMVFAGYGRGRVGEPFVGKGITPDNLAGELIFLTGECSCEVKDQNPGMDLLTTADWDAAAKAMTERFGDEEGSEEVLNIGQLVPSLSSGPPPVNEKSNQETSPDDSKLEPKEESGLGEIIPTSNGEKAERPAERRVSQAQRGARDVQSEPATPGDLGRNMAYTIGIGAGIVAALMLAVSVFYLRAGSK